MNNVLYLVWYEEEKNILNLIGELEYNENKNEYRFKYLNYETNELQLFSKNGLFPGFMEINEIYENNELFFPILKRLPSKKRVDYNILMKRYGFNENSNDFEILKQTKGASSDDYFIFITPDYYKTLKNKLN